MVDKGAVVAHMGAGGPSNRAVCEMAAPIDRIIYAKLPLHKQIVRQDDDYISNNLCMNLLHVYEDFQADADVPGLVENLL